MKTRIITPLAANELLVQTSYDQRLVLPTFNVDVVTHLLVSGHLEPGTSALVYSLLKPGDRALCVGAHFGHFSTLAGLKVGYGGRVAAIEANPHLFPFLIKSSYYSGTAGHTDLHCCAVSDRRCMLEFRCDPQWWGGGGVAGEYEHRAAVRTLEECIWSADNIATQLDDRYQFHSVGIYTRRLAPAVPLDELFPTQAFDLIQMDIEGAESLAIAGGREMIARNPKANLILEICPLRELATRRSDQHQAMFDFLCGDLRKRVYAIAEDDSVPQDGMPRLTEIQPGQFADLPLGNYLFTDAIA